MFLLLVPAELVLVFERFLTQLAVVFPWALLLMPQHVAAEQFLLVENLVTPRASVLGRT